jgi:hypothetical protein
VRAKADPGISAVIERLFNCPGDADSETHRLKPGEILGLSDDLSGASFLRANGPRLGQLSTGGFDFQEQDLAALAQHHQVGKSRTNTHAHKLGRLGA